MPVHNRFGTMPVGDCGDGSRAEPPPQPTQEQIAQFKAQLTEQANEKQAAREKDAQEARVYRAQELRRQHLHVLFMNDKALLEARVTGIGKAEKANASPGHNRIVLTIDIEMPAGPSEAAHHHWTPPIIEANGDSIDVHLDGHAPRMGEMGFDPARPGRVHLEFPVARPEEIPTITFHRTEGAIFSAEPFPGRGITPLGPVVKAPETGLKLTAAGAGGQASASDARPDPGARQPAASPAPEEAPKAVPPAKEIPRAGERIKPFFFGQKRRVSEIAKDIPPTAVPVVLLGGKPGLPPVEGKSPAAPAHLNGGPAPFKGAVPLSLGGHRHAGPVLPARLANAGSFLAGDAVLSEKTEAIQPTPVQPITVELTKVEPTTVQPIPVQLTTVQLAPVQLAPVQPTAVEPTLVLPTPEPVIVEPTPVQPTPVQPFPVLSAAVLSTNAQPTPVQPVPGTAGSADGTVVPAPYVLAVPEGKPGFGVDAKVEVLPVTAPDPKPIALAREIEGSKAEGIHAAPSHKHSVKLHGESVTVIPVGSDVVLPGKAAGALPHTERLVVHNTGETGGKSQEKRDHEQRREKEKDKDKDDSLPPPLAVAGLAHQFGVNAALFNAIPGPADQGRHGTDSLAHEVVDMVQRFLVTADPGSYVKELHMTLNPDILPGTEIRFRMVDQSLTVTFVNSDGNMLDKLRAEAPELAKALNGVVGSEVEIRIETGEGRVVV